MASVLDRSQEEQVAEQIIELQDETGYTPEEFIPGLMVAARELATRSTDKGGQVLDEAVNILEESDGY